MDRHIITYPSYDDGDLVICDAHGVAYQKDRSNVIEYDYDYFDKCAGYENSEIAVRLNKGRVDFVNTYYRGEVLDIGVGSGEFIKSRPHTFGYDINPKAVEWLFVNGFFRDNFDDFNAFTFWDVIEHVETPENYLIKMPAQAYVFISIPVFHDLWRIRESKHYRPGEHLYYWTGPGMIEWMRKHGFELLESSWFETSAGRDQIQSFAFRKYGEQ